MKNEHKCMVCGGTLTERKVNRMQEFEGRWYLIENVPALACAQCGEVYYSLAANDMVLRLVRAPVKPTRIEQVAVLAAAP